MSRPHHAKWRKNPHLSFNLAQRYTSPAWIKQHAATYQHSNIHRYLWRYDALWKDPCYFVGGEIPYRKDSNFRFLTLSFQPHLYVKWWFLSFLDYSDQQHKICDAVHIMHLELSTMESWQGFLDACLIHRWRIFLSSVSLDASKKGETKLQIHQFQR